MPKASSKSIPKKTNGQKTVKKGEIKTEAKDESKIVPKPALAQDQPSEEKETAEARREILNIIKEDSEQGKPVSSVSDKPKPKSKTKAKSTGGTKVGQKIGLVVLAVIIIFILAVGVFSFGLYQLKWHDKITQKIVKALPFPAAIVNYQAVSYESFNKDLAALKNYYQKQNEMNPEVVDIPGEDDLRSMIINKLIKESVLKQQAKAMKISVTDEELQQELDKVIVSTGSRELLEQSLQELYNWTISDFTSSILKTYIFREKMQEKLSFDDSLNYNQAAKQKIEEAYAKITKENKTFEEVADQYNEDQATGEGGDLGFVSRTDLDQVFADAAFSLEEGKVSEIVHTRYGYHIIKVDEKIKGVDSEDTSSNGEEVIHVRHILVRVDLDSWLDNKLDIVRVFNFII
ncbi:MAG: peptidylprolyl isomerase [Patescibacteria group bacterium]|nr:peptidylprolyl isomerase [Patescibacteria group bacterium]